MKLPQFVPILTAFTARVAGCEKTRLLQSPTVLARALADTQVVVGHDGVLCIFDPLLLLSACLCQQDEMPPAGESDGVALKSPDEILRTGPLANLLETIQPLRHQLPESAKIFATFTGPELLYSQLQNAFESHGKTGGINPDYVVEVILNAVRSSLELKADGIALIEQAMPAQPSELLRSHKKVRKLADFYDTGFLVFRLPGPEEQGPDFSAHCVFDLASPENGIGPVIGQLGPSIATNILPFTTTGDVPETTTVEGLKTLLQVGRCA